MSCIRCGNNKTILTEINTPEYRIFYDAVNDKMILYKDRKYDYNINGNQFICDLCRNTMICRLIEKMEITEEEYVIRIKLDMIGHDLKNKKYFKFNNRE